MLQPHRVVIVAFPGIEVLDVTGPAEVFSVATRVVDAELPGTARPSGAAHTVARQPSDAPRRGYEVLVATTDGGPVTTSSGVRLLADLPLDRVAGADTLLVAGAVEVGTGGVTAVTDPAVVAWLRAEAPRARRVGSICAGARLLAEAGLLDGRPATTHWLTAAQLAADHPQVTVEPDPIFVRAGNVWTCAGITAGMDMALAMVTEDLGQEAALATARAMVMYVKRSGGQSQFSVPLSVPAPPAGDPLEELLRWVGENPTADLSAEALADRMHLSARHFTRLFRRRTATTPAAYVESARLEAARRMLEEGDEGLPGVAAASGLGSVETLHRAFRRRLGTTPAEYRRRFR